MKTLFRRELVDIRPYVPGKPIEEVQKEYGIEHVDKLASNENPLGPSPMALEAIRKELENINIYPDGNSTALRLELAAKFAVKPENIVLGSGGEQVLQLIAQTLINEGDEAIMAAPSFGTYSSSVAHMGGVPVKIPLKNYKHDFAEFINRINEKTKLIYVCNPNNPTGNIMTKDEIDYLVANVPDDVVIIFDEAYYDYARLNPEYPETLPLLQKRPNTVILRTFSKVSGIAGIRVGYAFTSPEISSEVNKVRGAFNVSKLAQVAAIGALHDTEHIAKTVKLNYESLAIMEEFFKRNSFEYIPTNANFVFANVNIDSRIIFEELMKRGIIIRPGYLWGWDNWLRISTGTIEQTHKLVQALAELTGK